MARVQPIAHLSMYVPRRRGAALVDALSSATSRVRGATRSQQFIRRSIVNIKVWAALVAVIVLPFIFESTTGCGFQAQEIGPVDTNAYTCSCTCSPGLRHRSLRVSASADDAEQQLDNTILLTSPDLDFQNGRFVGLRFPDVQIPKGSQIFAANVQFTAAPGSTAGTLTVRIAAEATANAAPFTTTPGSLGALPTTTNSVQWDLINPWTTGAAGADQSTPNFKTVVQEVVNQPQWAAGKALVVLFRGTAGTAIRKAFAQDGNAAAAALLTIEYQEPAPTTVGPQDLPICLPPALVPNRSETDLVNDCQDRVAQTLSGLAEACGYPSDCHCGLQANATTFSQSLKWANQCDMPCTEEQVDVANDCANFDPVHGLTSATNADGDQPVCLANSPLAAEVFGRRTMCAVEGMAHVEVEDESKDSHTQGIVQFTGDPCVGGGCAVGMQYQLDIDPVTFGNFFHSETFRDLAGIGETGAGAKTLLSAGGDGSFARDAAGVSAQGRRGSDLRGLATTNDDPVNVNVAFGASAPTCHVTGTLIGSVDPELKRCEGGPDAGKICDDDSQCTNDPACSDKVCNCLSVSAADLSLSLDVAGDILNQPPTADAGPDQTVECATAAVTEVVLDASGSSDLDANLALFTWLRGTRGGPMVGFDEVSKVEQSLGTQSYVLRVIDAFGQTDEDTTHVDVVDTTPPSVICSVMTAALNQNDHDLVNVGLIGSAVDQCEGELPVTVSVFSDEDDDENTGDGHHSPDAKDIAPVSLRLRAERNALGDGRVYLIVVEATDSSGNRGSDCCVVDVPSSSSLTARTSASAEAEAARTFCTTHQGTAPAGYFAVGDGPELGPKQ
jgi:hypothetical protein